MCKLSKGQINPLIGSAGVSAVPMAARISEDVGRESDPSNHLLMHAMGPNVAGVIGSAVRNGLKKPWLRYMGNEDYTWSSHRRSHLHKPYDPRMRPRS